MKKKKVIQHTVLSVKLASTDNLFLLSLIVSAQSSTSVTLLTAASLASLIIKISHSSCKTQLPIYLSIHTDRYTESISLPFGLVFSEFYCSDLSFTVPSYLPFFSLSCLMLTTSLSNAFFHQGSPASNDL